MFEKGKANTLRYWKLAKKVEAAEQELFKLIK